MAAILTVDGLCKSFRLSAKQQKIEKSPTKVRHAVQNLSFSVNEGEIFGLLGPNGAGKTTTLRMIATLIRPDAGDAWLEGVSVVREPEKVRGKIGFLTSDLKLEEFFTPDYLFDFFSEVHGVPTDIRNERKKDLFARFGIDAFAQVKSSGLSTGMKQKTSLALSVVHSPNVIIFDEPTNGLDVITAKTVTDFLLDIRKEGKTVILSTHIFSLVEKLCDRVGILLDGQLAACGTLPDVCGDMDMEERFFALYREKQAAAQKEDNQ